MFTFRKVEVRDKERVLEISSKIWDGYDYIPHVFDEWIQDQEGEFTLAEYDGEIAGFAKYTQLTTKEAWLEGIRADKDFAGKGFGDAMTKYYIHKAKRENQETIRLSTFVENYQSKHIIEKNGFKKDGFFSYCFKEIKECCAKGQANAVAIMSTATAWSYIENSRFNVLSNGYLSSGWRFYKLTYELLDGLVRSGNVIGILKEGRISAMTVIWGDLKQDKEISISFMDGDLSGIKTLLEHIEHLAHQENVKTIEFMSVLNEDLIDTLESMNYEFIYEKPKEVNVYVYTMKIDKSH